jgi:hypothetical protein
LLLLALPVAARDSALSWHTIDTPHFQLHFHDGLEPVAWRAAHLCEEAHAVLTPLYGHRPDRRVQVNLTDFGDSANGSATALPYPKINLFAAPPTIDGNLSDYDDWLRLLIFHEYVHILQLDNVSGLPAWINGVLGKTAAPNQNLPSFQLEGGAVWAESRTSGRGRIRSALFRGTLRAQALAGQLHGPDAVVHVPQDWPGANVWYMYGGHFHQWLAEQRDAGAASRYHDAFSDQLIPFGLNRAVNEATGQTWTTLYRAWQADLTARAQVEARRIEQLGTTAYRTISAAPFRHQSPRYRANGDLLSIEFAHHRRTAIYQRTPTETGATGHELYESESMEGYDVCPNGHLVLDQGEPHLGLYRFHDLYRWDPTKAGAVRLTRGARVREPACAPDDRWVAAVQMLAGRTRLVEVSLLDGVITPLHDPGALNQMAYPVVSPDGAGVVAVRISAEHGRDLVHVDRATGTVRRVTADHALELHPRFSRDGRWLVYASDRDGIFNLYAQAWPAGGPPRRLTRVITGALDPALSPDGERIAFTLLSADGYDLVDAPFAPEQAPPAVQPIEAAQPSRPAASDVPLPTRPYSPLPTLWPVAWSPSFSFTDAEESASTLGMELSAADVAGQHMLFANVATTPEDESLSVGLAYTLFRFTPVISLGLNHATRTRAGGALWGSVRNDWRERVTSFSSSVSLPFSRGGKSASASLRYGLTAYSPAENPEPVHDPLDQRPSLPQPLRASSLSLSVRFGETDRHPNAITTSEGRGLALTLRVRHPAMGGELETAEALFNYSEFVSLWARHVLAFRISGALGRGHDGRRAFYGLGPPPERNLALDLLDEIQYGSTFLRGYPAGTVQGDRYVLSKLEYRLPLLDAFVGPESVPAFFQRLKLALFTDWAQADTAPLTIQPSAFSRSVGAELVTEATVAWRMPVSIRMGYAWGFDPGGDHQIYVFLGQWF